MSPAEKTAIHTPVRSLPQRMDALAKANEIRSQRAQIKREIKEGKRDIVSVLREPPEYLMSAKVIDLVMVVPKFGRVKATRLLTRCRVSQAKTVGGLSDRQRVELIEWLEARG